MSPTNRATGDEADGQWSRSKTLGQLLGMSYIDMPKEQMSGLIESVDRLLRSRLEDIDGELLLTGIEERIGLQYLLPMALEELSGDLFVDLFIGRGDLLKAVLQIPDREWGEHRLLAKRLVEIIRDGVSRVREDISPFIRSELRIKCAAFCDKWQERSASHKPGNLSLRGDRAIAEGLIVDSRGAEDILVKATDGREIPVDPGWTYESVEELVQWGPVRALSALVSEYHQLIGSLAQVGVGTTTESKVLEGHLVQIGEVARSVRELPWADTFTRQLAFRCLRLCLSAGIWVVESIPILTMGTLGVDSWRPLRQFSDKLTLGFAVLETCGDVGLSDGAIVVLVDAMQKSGHPDPAVRHLVLQFAGVDSVESAERVLTEQGIKTFWTQ